MNADPSGMNRPADAPWLTYATPAPDSCPFCSHLHEEQHA